jgi:hypothetical protein
MPADRRTWTIFVDQGHGESVSIDTSPASNLGAQWQQEVWKRSSGSRIVRLAKERDAPAGHDAPHFEVREADFANSVDQGSLIGMRNEVLAIREARWHTGFEEARRRRHDPVSHDALALESELSRVFAVYRQAGELRTYEHIGDWIVPHVAGRPLTLFHCPAGIAAPCHYLKHAKAWGPSALRRVRIQEKTKVGEYLRHTSFEACDSQVNGEWCMPFKSQAQRRKFAQLLVEGKISNQTFEEWNRETGRKRLPERVGSKSKSPRKAKPPGRRRAAKKR